MSDRLRQMIDAVLSRDGRNDIESLIIPAHVAQMKLFGIRQGVEFFPGQDTPGDHRKNFIKRLWKENKLDVHLDRLWDYLLCKGSVLLYLRPTKNSYRIHYFYGSKNREESQFFDYYDEDGELVEVVIIYSFTSKSNFATMPEQKRWLKLRITKDRVYQSESEIKPSFANDIDAPGVTEYENSLGFIPCVTIKNYWTEDGKAGADEFSWLGSQIIRHDSMSKGVAENMEFFGNPMLVSTRSANEVLEATWNSNMRNFRPTMASQGSFVGFDSPSSRVDDPRFRPITTGQRVRKVIGNVEENERFGFVHPDPVSPDHSRYLAQHREMLRTALGGVDELGLNSGATAFELKSLYGRAAATALKKCQSLYTYGLCELFAMAIKAEEHIFRYAISVATQTEYGSIPDEQLVMAAQQGMIPPGMPGLLPYGDRTVSWRWKGPVFEDSPRDILDKSIVGRNLREEGVSTPEILKMIYPDRTDKEIQKLASGYPTRGLQNIAGTTGNILGLWGQMLQMPDPMNPEMPLGLRLNLSPLLERSIQALMVEMGRVSEYEPDFEKSPGVEDLAQVLGKVPSPLEIEQQQEIQRQAELMEQAQKQTPSNRDTNGLRNSTGSGSSSSGSTGSGTPDDEPTSPPAVPSRTSVNAVVLPTYGTADAVPGDPYANLQLSDYGYAAPFPGYGTDGQPVPGAGTPANVVQSGYPVGPTIPNAVPGPAAGGGVPGQPMETGIQFGGFPAQYPNRNVPQERNAPLPRPGTSVGTPTVSNFPYQPIWNPTAVPSQSLPANQPGLLQQLFPTFTGAINAVTGSTSRKRNGKRKSKG